MSDLKGHSQHVVGQGSPVDEATRIAYLKAMGIQPWFSKNQTVIDDVSVSAVEPELEVSEEGPGINVDAGVEIAKSSLEQLQHIVSQCQLCELHASRIHTVFGSGKTDADLLIIGEAPGEDEDEQGEPFVGHAGQLLNAMLQAIGLDRQVVYLTNVIKCHPPENRNPHVSETICCDPYLQRQIELVKPKLILALGRIAAQHLLMSQDNLGAMRDKQYSYNGIPLIVSYHPAYLLRKPTEKRKSWQDLQRVKRLLDSSI